MKEKILKYLKRIFLDPSLKIRIAIFFLFSYFLLTFILIEYTHGYFKRILTEKLEEDLKNSVNIAYNEILDFFTQMDKGAITYDQLLKVLRNRFNGNLKYLSVELDKNQFKENFINFFNDFDLEIKEEYFEFNKNQDAFSIKMKKYGNPELIIKSLESDKFLITIPQPLSQIFYDRFIKFDEQKQQEYLNRYRLKFTRDLSKASIRIGEEGYVYVISAYEPPWFLEKTHYPEDYTLEKITERFKNQFKGYLSEEGYKEYITKFGDTPQKQYDYIKKYMMNTKNKPDAAIAIIHPYLENHNLDNISFRTEFPARRIAIQKSGYYRYLWKNPEDPVLKNKIAYLKYFRYINFKKNMEIKWVVGIGSYEEESYYFLRKLYYILYAISGVLAILTLIHMFIFLKFSINRPIEEIISKIRKVNAGDYDVRVKQMSKDELGYIATTLNHLIESIKKKNKELQDYADNLQRMVEEKTIELQNSLREIRKLKEIQDGDYYLTSLLIEQLGKKHDNLHVNIKADFFIKEKKEFEFRKKHGEIGGDLCLLKTIYLQEKPYIFFLNADSMGKSIQGAVGSLIIGSVMESVLDRTLKAFTFKNYSPERWLKNSFLELMHIFESFNGAMGATLIMGLVDANLGTLYYINSEHPPIVLYRNGKAEYIMSDFHFPALGRMNRLDLKQEIFVSTFQLKKNDRIYIGSDGKDDIRLPEGYINSNHELFLKILEKTQGDLYAIYEELMKIGELTDDLSILYLELNSEVSAEIPVEEKKYFNYLRKKFIQNPDQEIMELEKYIAKYPFYVPALKLALRQYLKQKNYKKIEYYAEKYLEYSQASFSILYLIFYAKFRQKKFTEAIDFGERCYLRKPDNINLLLQLSQCYFKINVFHRAEYLIEKAMSFEPDNPKILEFMKNFRIS